MSGNHITKPLLSLLLAASLQAEPICGKTVVTEQYMAQVSCIDWDLLARWLPVAQRGKQTQVIVMVNDPKVYALRVTVSGESKDINVVNGYAYSAFAGHDHATFDIGVKP